MLGALEACALVSASIAIGILGRPKLAQPDVVMLFVLAIMVVAVRHSRALALFAAALSVAAYDFFFVPPFHTFAVDELRNLLTFAMLFALAVVLSTLNERARKSERAAADARLKANTEEMKSTLLSAVSHDMRTPLAAITGAATTLRDNESLSTAQRRELVETVCEEAERMERVVRNLLDMTRLQSGALAVAREWIPVEEMIGSALVRLDRALAGRAITTHIPEDLPMVEVDPVLVEQVLINLLENAAKYTPAQSPIDLSARRTDTGVELVVADRGPGIAPEELSLVFEKFYRGASARPGGVGLGLAISRGIIEAHGGSLFARARPNGGAEFVVELPVSDKRPSLPPELSTLSERRAP